MMATKRKPSAAQIAARKLFAQRAKAGIFTGKPRRKRNPSSGRSAQEYAPGWTDSDEERNRNPKARRKGVGRSRSGPYPSAAWNDTDQENIRASVTKRNPVARMKVIARKRNPDAGASSAPSAFKIYRADRDGRPHGTSIASAASKADAVSIARHLADGKRRALVIVGKK